jgi:hypothetical protein
MTIIQGFHCDTARYNTLHPGLLHSLHYSPSYLTLLLKMPLMGFNVPSSHMYIKYLNHINYSLSSSFSLPSPNYPPLSMTCFTFLSFIV